MLDIKQEGDVIIIEGIRYSECIFKEWGISGMPIGTHFVLEDRKDGVITIRRVENANQF